MYFAHSLSAWALAAVLALVTVLAALAYARAVRLTRAQRSALAGLRWLALVALLLALMRPVVPLPPAPGGHAVVAVVMDTSRSMGLEDAPGRSRLDEARTLVYDRLLPDLSRTYTVEVLAAGDRLQPAADRNIAAAGRQSDLAGAIAAARDRFRDRELAGIVLVSDGGDTGAGGWDAEPPPGLAPVIAVGVGHAAIRFDREVRSVTAGPSAMDASLVDLTATLVAHGATGVSQVRLLQGTRVLEVRDVRLPQDGSPHQETFAVAPDRNAPAVFRVELRGGGDELTLANNRVDTLVSPPGRPRRILVVEGAPGFEHTFLKRAWQQDPSLDVDSVVRKGRTDQGEDTFYVQAGSTRTAALTTGFPPTRESLFVYDAVILANAEPDRLTRDALEMLADFVGERGGGLLVLGSRALAPQGFAGSLLDRVLPVDLTDRRGGLARTALPAVERLRVALTAEGQRHPVMRLGEAENETRRRWAALPQLAGAAPLGAARPGAVVLAVTQSATGSTVPLVAVQRYGRGRAMIFGGEASWRWKMMMPAADRTYESFWRQAVRWLSSDAPDPVALTAASGAALGASVPLEVTVRNEAFAPVPEADVRITVREPDGLARELVAQPGDAPGRHDATLVLDEPGLYRVAVEVRSGGNVLGSREQVILAGGIDPEFTDPRLNETVLRRLAERTGGRLVPLRDAGTVGDLLRAHRAPERPREFRDVWHNAWWFLLVVGLLSSEWVLRRRWGLR